MFLFYIDIRPLITEATKMFQITNLLLMCKGDRGSTVVKVLRYNSEGRWFDPSWCQWIFH